MPWTERKVLSQVARPDTAAQKPPAERPAAASLTVVVQGFRSNQGDALLALFREAANFPGTPEKASVTMVAPLQGGRARFSIESLAPGTVALSVLHDEDGDRKLKTGIFGIPKEGLGFSRDARARFGPPKFEDARFVLTPGKRSRMSIRMSYY